MQDSKQRDNKTLAAAIWGIDWAKHFPKALDPSVRVEVCSPKEFRDFADRYFKDIYKESTERKLSAPSIDPAKRAEYYQRVGDHFLLREGDAIVGGFVGTTDDWCTYYIRNFSLFPSHQGRGLFQKFLDHFIAVLEQNGVACVTTDVAPSNFANIHIFNKLGFYIAGLHFSERWGTLVHFVRYLRSEDQWAFINNFL